MKKKWVVGAVLVVVIVAVIAVAFRLTLPAPGSAELSGKRVEAVFLAYEIRPETANQIFVGSALFDENGRKCFTITDVNIRSAQETAYNSEGTAIVTPHPVLKDVTITAQSIDRKVSWAYIYGRDKILAGANVAIYGDLWKVWTRILTVTELP